jgi:hypothetical protein
VSIFVYVENIYDVGNPAPGLGQTNHVAWLNRLIENKAKTQDKVM